MNALTLSPSAAAFRRTLSASRSSKEMVVRICTSCRRDITASIQQRRNPWTPLRLHRHDTHLRWSGRTSDVREIEWRSARRSNSRNCQPHYFPHRPPSSRRTESNRAHASCLSPGTPLRLCAWIR
jgi:hypothetical protein